MKILFVSAVLPYPLHSGGQIRIYNLLKRLGEKHDITLCSFIRDSSELSLVNQFRFCRYVYMIYRGRVWQPKYLWKTLTSSYPLLWNSYRNGGMLALLAGEITKGTYDLIHIEPGYVWPSLPMTQTPVVVSEHNVEHQVYEGFVRQFPIAPFRPFLSWDVAKMKFWEKRIWKEATRVVAVSPGDKREIETLSGRKDIAVVPNGVDIKEFTFRPKKMLAKDKPVFLYIGNFRWMENRDAAEQLTRVWWPVIHKTYPSATLRIVGPNAPAGPYFVGSVENIQDELNSADIMLAPIRIGGGTKYKILEAMASGLPVITTPVGIQGMSDTQVCVVENSDDMLSSIAGLFDNKHRLNIVTKARKRIEKEYSWDLIAQKLDTIWNSL